MRVTNRIVNMFSETISLYKKFFLKLVIALVWLVNGLFCKAFNFVPRHQKIVGRILGEEHAELFTKTIGILEIGMAAWIVSNIKSRFCAITQIIVIAVMNTIEFFLVPDLLLFGRLNALFATCFILLIFYNEFFWQRSSNF